jgi:hypothetical protein
VGSHPFQVGVCRPECAGPIVLQEEKRLVGVVRYGGHNSFETIREAWCERCGVLYKADLFLKPGTPKRETSGG